MALITTDFAGSESTQTVYSRLESIIDYYYGAGHFATLGSRAAVRAAINDLQQAASDISAGGELASSFIAKLNRLNNPANLVPEMEAIIEANTAAFWDFSDTSTVNSGSPTAGDVISDFTSRSIGTLTTASWVASTTARPTWQTTYADFNGTSNQLIGDSGGAGSMFQNAASGFLAASFRLDTLSSDRSLLTFSEGVTNTSDRIFLGVLSSGALRLLVRREDGGAIGFRDSATGLITTGVDYTVLATCDWSAGGAGAIKGYINGGADVLNGTLAGTGNTSNTASLRIRMGIALGSAARMDGRIYKAAAGRFIPTQAQRAILTGVLAP